MKLILIRHGETSWNAKNKLQSYTDIELNTKGLEQAKKTGNYLKHINPDIILSSPLKRAKQTAKQINKHHNNKILIIDKLTERNFGKLEGSNYLNLTNKINHIHKNNLYEEYEIETLSQIKKRITTFWENISQKHMGKTVMIISHSSAIKTLLEIILNKNHSEIKKLVKKSNCSITTIEFEKDYKIK